MWIKSCVPCASRVWCANLKTGKVGLTPFLVFEKKKKKKKRNKKIKINKGKRRGSFLLVYWPK
jgi:hypothetical protein